MLITNPLYLGFHILDTFLPTWATEVLLLRKFKHMDSCVYDSLRGRNSKNVSLVILLSVCLLLDDTSIL